MICPHCRKNVKYKNRSNKRCGYCRKTFALEPKSDPFRLNDLRFRRLDEKLSEGGLWYSSTQLWYAAARKVLPAPRLGTAAKVVLGIVVALNLLFIPIAVVTGNLRWNGAAAVALVVVLTFVGLRWLAAHRWRIVVPMSHQDFRRIVLPAWVRVYGTEPPALIRDPHAALAVNPPSPVLAVLCPDPSVLSCLRANGVGIRLNVALVATVEEVPPNAPVALLHDTSVDGYAFAAWARGRLGARRVFDISPRPRTVAKSKGSIRLRGARPAQDVIERLRATGGFTDEELTWLARGSWSPIAGLRPKALIGRVRHAVERAGRADPDRRAAAAVGFMSWPGG